jgi:hypothetical protein
VRDGVGEGKFLGKLAERRGGDGDLESEARMKPSLLERISETFSSFVPME